MQKLPTAAALTILTALPALAVPPAVIADIPVTGMLVQQVIGDLGKVHVLAQTGSNPHHHQLRPSDAAALQDAGLLVWVGSELTPWLERSAQSLSTGQQLELLQVPETHIHEFTEAHDHEAEHDHDHGVLDPHAWLDPANGKLWLQAIAEALGEADPENAAIYANNANAGIAQIDQMVASLTAELAPFADQRLAVPHDAYGYFTEAFALQPAIAIAHGDAASPSAARLIAIRDEMQAQSVRCAFPEAGHDPALIESVVLGTDIRLGGVLDPSGVGIEPQARGYPDLLQAMGSAIVDCLGQTK